MYRVYHAMVIMLFFMTCTNDKISGTVSDTDTGKSAMIYNPDLTPAVGASVHFFQINDTTRKPALSTSTDTNGRYSYKGLAKGTYNIIAGNDSLLSFQDSATITEDTAYIRIDTLGKPGSITAYAGVQQNDDPRTVTVQVLGTDIFSNVDASGRFTLAPLAKGTYNIRLTTIVPHYTATYITLTVQSGKNDTLQDTLWLIYTGIPVVTGLSARYDTTIWAVCISWKKTAYSNFQDYLLFRDPCDSVQQSKIPFKNITDTFYVDTIFYKRFAEGPFSYSDTNNYCFNYRVGIRNNSGEPGLTYKFVSVKANSPQAAPIAPRLFMPDGGAAAGATVKIFAAGEVNGQCLSKQMTTARGYYSISGLPKDVYNVWFEKDSLVAFHDSVLISENGPLTWMDTLDCPSSILGIAGVQPNHDPRSVTIRVVGTDKYCTAEQTGRFAINGIAGGNYSILLKSTLPNYTPTFNPLSVHRCTKDTLQDTLWLLYTDIPVVTGLSTSYDTLKAIVKFTWSKTPYRDLQNYVIYRDFYDSVNLSATPIAARSDTVFMDTIFKLKQLSGPFSFADTNNYQFKYRVAIRTNTGMIGQTYRYISIIAASPTKVKTVFKNTVYHCGKGFFTDSASVMDTLLYTVRINNPTRSLRKLKWVDLNSGTTLGSVNLNVSVTSLIDTVRYFWKLVGTTDLECSVFDDADTEWKDTIRISIVKDVPIISISASDTIVPLGDTVKLNFAGSDNFGSIIKWELDGGNAGKYHEISGMDTLVIMSDSTIKNYPWIVRATDDDGNIVTDSLFIRVALFKCATANAAFSPRSFINSCVVFDNRMWVIGGYYDASVHKDVWYSSDGVNWSEATANTPFGGRLGSSSVVFDKKIWVIGGSIYPTGLLTNDVWCSSDGTNWVLATDNAVFSPREGHSSVVYNNKIWVIGGRDSVTRNDVWYSIDGVLWICATDNAGFGKRSGHRSVIFDNKMWVIGGSNYKDLWYSIDGVSWIEKTQLTIGPILPHSAIVTNDEGTRIWVSGGSTTSIVFSDQVWFSIDGALWYQEALFSGFSPRTNHSSLYFDKKLWIIGGLYLSQDGMDQSYKNDVWFCNVP
jgi:hypothetical protein